jgi:hypothetical protein
MKKLILGSINYDALEHLSTVFKLILSCKVIFLNVFYDNFTS